MGSNLTLNICQPYLGFSDDPGKSPTFLIMYQNKINVNNFVSEKFCNWFYDEKTCWPTAKANTNVSQPCPLEQGFDKMSTDYIIFLIKHYMIHLIYYS